MNIALLLQLAIVIRKEYHRRFIPFVIDEDYYLLTMPDGTRYRLDNIIQPDSHNVDRHGWYATEITDVHGNQVLIEYWGKEYAYPEAIKSVSIKPKDGLVRKVLETTLWDADESRPWITGTLKTLTARVLEPDGSEREIKYNFFYEREWNTTEEFQTGDEHGVGYRTVHIPILTAVSVSPGMEMPPATVGYDYAEEEGDCLMLIPKLTKIIYPTGGETEYKYGWWVSGTRHFNYCLPFMPVPNHIEGYLCENLIRIKTNGVVARTIYPKGKGNGNPSATWTWDRMFHHQQWENAFPPNDVPHDEIHNYFIVTEPDGSYSRSEFYGNPDNNEGRDFDLHGWVKNKKSYSVSGLLLHEEDFSYDWVPATLGDAQFPDRYKYNSKVMVKDHRVWFSDDSGSCFQAGSQGNLVLTQNFNKDGHGHWKTTVTTSDYFQNGRRRVSHKNWVTARSNAETEMEGILDSWTSELIDDGAQQAEMVISQNPFSGEVLSARIKTQLGNAASASTNWESWNPVGLASQNNDPQQSMVYSNGDLTHLTFSGGDADADGNSRSYSVQFGYQYGQAVSAQLLNQSPIPNYKLVDSTINELGWVKSSRDPNGIESQFAYDNLGRLTQASPPGIEKSSRIYYPTFNDLRVIRSDGGSDQEFNPSDSTQRFGDISFDGIGRVVKRQNALPDGTLAVQYTSYDAMGRVIYISEWVPKAQADSLGMSIWKDNIDDSKAKYWAEFLPIPGNSQVPWGTVTFYGTPDSQNPRNPLLTVGEGLGRVRRIEVIRPGENSGTYTFDSVDKQYCGPHVRETVNNVSVQGASSSVTTTYYNDAEGKLAYVDAPEGADAAYQYDINGKVTEVNLITGFSGNPFQAWKTGTLPRGQSRRFVYDSLGRQIKTNIPEQGDGTFSENKETDEVDSEVFAFDPWSKPLITQDAMGKKRGYFFAHFYDKAGRLVRTEKRLGSPAARITSDVDRLDGNGSFDNSGLSGWTAGQIDTADSFVAGSSPGNLWRQQPYGECLAAPPVNSGSGGLYFGEVANGHCTYGNAGSEYQVLRRAVNGVTRDDILQFKYWRQVRQDSSGGQDEFSVWVVKQSEGNSVTEKRVLFWSDSSLPSAAVWEEMPPVRPGDAFSLEEWPDASGSTQNLFLYIVFRKKQNGTTGLGGGVAVDDLFLGRRWKETLAVQNYDEDICSSFGALCQVGSGSINARLSKLTSVESYEGGHLTSKRVFVYKGLNGRPSGEGNALNLRGLKPAGSDTPPLEWFYNRWTHDPFGEVDTWELPTLYGQPVHSYRATQVVRGFPTGLEGPDAQSLIPAGGITYDIHGAPSSVAFANGTSQSIFRDTSGRLKRIVSTGPQTQAGSATLFDSGSYSFDGAGRITQIGEQNFQYDAVGRLTRAEVTDQARDRILKPNADPLHVLTYTYDPFGNITSQNLVRPGGDAPLGFNFTRTFTSASQTLNRNRVLATLDGFQFSYDANGNTLAYTGKLGLGAGGWWDERNRMVVHVAGQPHTAAARPVEYYRYDSGGLRWMRRDSKGVVHLMLRSAAGQAQTEYVLPPGAAAPKLDREYVSATGGVAVERVRAAEALKVVGGVHTTGATSLPFRVPNVQLGTQVMVDIRTPDGPGAQLRNVLLDSQGRFTVNDSLFVPGVTNYLRVKEEGNQRSPWSAPVAVQLNGETTSSSANQIRSISVSRSATNIIVRWGLLSENGRTTKVYFKRADTGALVSLTPQGLSASVREFSLQIQALAIPCGAFYASQAGGGLPESPMIGVDNPTFHEGLSSQLFNIIDCGGGGTNPPDPEPEEPVFLTYYHHRDHLGSDRVVTDESGAAVSFHNYYPFGQEMAGGGTMGRFKFTGHERDEETGLDYMKARFFNGPSFLSVDPLGTSAVLSAPQTWNRYSYVSGDPIAKDDPLGLVEDPRTGGTMYDPSETKWKQPRSRFSRIEERGATQLTPESPPLPETANPKAVFADPFSGPCEYSKYVPSNVITVASDTYTQQEAETAVCAAIRAAEGNIVADQEIKRIRNLKGNVVVQVGAVLEGGQAFLSGLVPTVRWDPTAGWQTEAGGFQSPALGLLHEFHHITTTFDEEATTQWENRAAAWWGQAQRTNYRDGHPVTVFGPTSTTPVP